MCMGTGTCACACACVCLEDVCCGNQVCGHGYVHVHVPRGFLLRKSGVHAWACVCLADVWTCTCHGACALRMHTLMHMHMHMHMHRCARCRACTPSTRSAPKSGSRRRRCPLHAYMHTCIPSYVQCIHACTHACNARMHAMHACMQCTHALMHACIASPRSGSTCYMPCMHSMHTCSRRCARSTSYMPCMHSTHTCTPARTRHACAHGTPIPVRTGVPIVPVLN